MSLLLLTKNIEAVALKLKTYAGVRYGAATSPVESIVECYGNYLTSLAYAGFFFPTIKIVNGIPFATFPTATEETPLDCVHINMLHHNQAVGNEPEIFDALGGALAEIWTQNLKLNNLPGKFVYDTTTGFDVIYHP